MDIETVITGIAIKLNMESQVADWSPDKGDLTQLTNNEREWLLNKARQERFIRSVGILATLDTEKLDELIEEKRAETVESAA